MIREIEHEIRNLNVLIDIKIIRGESYKKESKRHRFLVAQLSHLKYNYNRGFLRKLAGSFASFVL